VGYGFHIQTGMSDIAALEKNRRRHGALNGHRPARRALVAPPAGILGRFDPAPWRRPAHLATFTATLDAKGRCGLRRAAEELGWRASMPMEVTADSDGAVSVEPSAKSSGVEFDSRLRLTIPLGVRFSAGLEAGDAVYIVCDLDARRLRLLGPAAALRGAA